jgi:hypothetical protein
VWKLADQMTWDDGAPVWLGVGAGTLERLQQLKAPITEPSQLVHGDMAGNILWHPDLPPAVIDFSPYRRPGEFAAALVTVDAVLWYGADPSLAWRPALDRHRSWCSVP